MKVDTPSRAAENGRGRGGARVRGTRGRGAGGRGEAGRGCAALALGLNTYDGVVTCRPVAEAHDLPYTPVADVLGS